MILLEVVVVFQATVLVESLDKASITVVSYCA